MATKKLRSAIPRMDQDKGRGFVTSWMCRTCHQRFLDVDGAHECFLSHQEDEQ